jgi:hypothetical protein
MQTGAPELTDKCTLKIPVGLKVKAAKPRLQCRSLKLLDLEQRTLVLDEGLRSGAELHVT